MYKIIVHPKADSDIDNILENLMIQNNKPYAIELINKIENCFDTLKNFPKIGKQSEISNFIDRKLRKYIIDNYIVYYDILEQSQTINIIRVMSGLMNIEHLL